MPPLIQSFVSYARKPSAVTAGSFEKQSQRGALPRCVASRFQLTQLGPPRAGLYDSVYSGREMMLSSAGLPSFGTPSSVLWPKRTPAPPAVAGPTVIVAEPCAGVGGSFFAV